MKATTVVAALIALASCTIPALSLRQSDPAAFEGVAATNFIQWSADGNHLLTGSPSGDMLFFEVDTGALKAQIKGGDSFSAFAVLLPGEKLIATSDYAGRLTLYDEESGSVIARKRGHEAEIACAACSPDGQRLATSDKEGDVVIWSWDGEELAIRHRIANAVEDFANQVTFSPDGTAVAVCGSASRADGTGEVAVYDAASAKRVMRAVTPAFVNSIEFDASGQTLYVGTARGKVRGLDVANGGPAQLPGGVGPQGIARARVVANDIALFYDEKGPAGAFAACGDGALRAVTFDGRTQWSVKADPSTCYFAALSPSGQRIATSGTDGTLKIFSLDGELIRSIGG